MKEMLLERNKNEMKIFISESEIKMAESLGKQMPKFNKIFFYGSLISKRVEDEKRRMNNAEKRR